MPGNVLDDLRKFFRETFSRGSGESPVQVTASLGEKGTIPSGGMRINFERTGGFMGTRLAVEVMTESLPQDEAIELETLVESARFFELPEILPAQAGMSDSFQYKVTVVKGDQLHTVETSEGAAPVELQPLIQHLTDVARAQRLH
jgi:hypothetical protein